MRHVWLTGKWHERAVFVIKWPVIVFVAMKWSYRGTDSGPFTSSMSSFHPSTKENSSCEDLSVALANPLFNIT